MDDALQGDCWREPMPLSTLGMGGLMSSTLRILENHDQGKTKRRSIFASDCEAPLLNWWGDTKGRCLPQ